MPTASVGPALGKYESQLAWMKEGNCAKHPDPNIHYPEKSNSSKKGKKQCSECPVIQLCREYALLNGEIYGIWGGMSEGERRKMRKKLIAEDSLEADGKNIRTNAGRVSSTGKPAVKTRDYTSEIIEILRKHNGSLENTTASQIGRMLNMYTPYSAAKVLHRMAANGLIEWQPQRNKPVTITLLLTFTKDLSAA